MTLTAAPVPSLDDETLHRLHSALGEVLASHQAEQATADGPEAEVHRVACESVQAALARISDGTYGRCTHCSTALPVERLEIIPQAELCMGCHDRRNRLYG